MHEHSIDRGSALDKHCVFFFICDSFDCKLLKNSQFAIKRISQLKPDLRYFVSENELLKATEREIYSCNRVIWLAQSDLTEAQQVCNQLHMEITLLVSECHHLEFELFKAGEDKKYNSCETMMEKHAFRVREKEKTLPLQEELEYLCSHMEDLKTHSMCLDLLQ